MSDNNSVVGGKVSMRQISYQVIFVQVLVIIFLSINILLIITFFRKECFFKTTRYILFAVTLLSDSYLLFLSNTLLIFAYLEVTMQIWLCVFFSFAVALYFTVTPVALTAMTLERYVAICMPLRHAELCSLQSTTHGIFIIHGLSSVPSIVILISFSVSTSFSFYKQYRVCSVEMLILHRWQGHLRSAVHLIYFSIMCSVIVFCYVKIMKVAKAASGEDKKLTQKGLRTVMLHAFQLLLCLIQLWCPFIEAAVLQIDLMLFVNVRYFNYITFILSPRCLSPLIYGLRDEKFFHALKCFALCGLYKN